MAEALSKLVPPDRPAPVFVSLVGDDAAGSFLTATLRQLRLDLSQLVTCPGATTPCVSAVLERGGEVAACVADVSTVEERLTPEVLGASKNRIQRASLVLAEGNLSAEALEYVSRSAAQAGVPVFLEPVSVPKAVRLVPSLSYATFVSPNAAELIAMADQVRRAAGLPLLPRPSLPEDGDADQGRGQGQAAAGAGSAKSERLLVESLRQLAVFAEVVLLQGTACVVLTLGSHGAALVTLSSGPEAAQLTHGSSGHKAHSDAAQSHPGVATSCTSGTCPAAAAASCGQDGRDPCSRGGCCGTAASSGGVAPGAPRGGAALSPSGDTWTSGAREAAAGRTGPVYGRGLLVASPASGRGAAGQSGVQVLHLRALPAEVVSVNGAGDTLVAGMVAALLQRQDPVKALAYGMAAAKRAVESQRNVPDLDFAALGPDADRVASTLHRYFFPSALKPKAH